jgi:hypothetical protein
MKLFHLSHTDLDGHSCQAVSSKFFGDSKFYNSNYGAEVSVKLKQMVHDIFTNCKKNDEVLFLITDLNLTTQECQFVDQECEKLSNFGININLQLLDHHISGKTQAASHKWYKLDIERSATKLTFEYLCAKFPTVQIENEFALFVKSVNAVDIWLENDEFFEFGKVFMRLILEAKEISKVMFANEHADYRIKLLYSALEFLKGDDLSDKHIELDDNVHKLRKSYLAQNQKNDTIDNLTSRFIVNLLGQKKNQMAVTINGKRGLFTTGLGNVSVVANYFLKNNEDFDFVIDLSGKGNLGLRSCDRVDVCEIAKNFFGGGGHTNASGGKMPNAREFYTYEEYLAFMNNYISTKEF